MLEVCDGDIEVGVSVGREQADNVIKLIATIVPPQRALLTILCIVKTLLCKEGVLLVMSIQVNIGSVEIHYAEQLSPESRKLAAVAVGPR